MSDAPPAARNGPPSSLPAPPAVNTGGWSGNMVPADVAGRVIAMLVDQARFASSITPRPTNSNTVVFPRAAPTGAAWLAELQRFPEMNLGDTAYEVAVAKLGGLVDLSNELVSDAQINITAEVGRLLRDSLSAQLDEGLLRGAGPPEPAGVIAAAPAVAGADLLAAAAAAVGAIGDEGGQATTLAASPSRLALESARTDGGGQLVYGAGGIGGVLGLTTVAVPALGEDALVYDASRLFLVTNGGLSSVEFSRDWHFAYDATTLRIRSRIAVAAPDPDRSLRKLTIGEGERRVSGGSNGGAERQVPRQR